MDRAGTHNLGDYALTAAVTNQVITSEAGAQGNTQAYIDRLEDMNFATISANFTYGSGGTNLKVIVETSDNQGISWTEVGRFAFTTASAEKKLNLIGSKEIAAAYTPIALSDDTGLSGVIGPLWRAKLTSTGVYAGNTAISVRLTARGA